MPFLGIDGYELDAGMPPRMQDFGIDVGETDRMLHVLHGARSWA